MPNNRHRRVTRLRTPEEREQYIVTHVNNMFDEDVNTVEEAQSVISGVIKKIMNKIKGTPVRVDTTNDVVIKVDLKGRFLNL